MSSVRLVKRFLLFEVCAISRGEVPMLTGHFSCVHGEWQAQWEMLKQKLALERSLLLVVLAHHNSVMMPGVDTERVPTELPAVVKVQRVEGTIVKEL